MYRAGNEARDNTTVSTSSRLTPDISSTSLIH